MLTLNKLVVRDDKTPSHFEALSIETNFKKIFGCKHINKYLNMVAKNDKYLGRQTTFAINYHDGEKFAQFCLLKA